MKRAVLLLGLAALAGCSLDPHYVRPVPAVPASWPRGDAYLKASEAMLPTITYKDVFRDPDLQAIIGQALANNQDLRIALANVESARALYRVQRAQLFPQIGVDGRVTTGRNTRSIQTGAGSGSGATSPRTSSATTTNYSVQGGVTAFELDLFGRLHSLSRAALQQYLATEAGSRAARLTLVGDIALAYLTLATNRSLLAIAIDTEASAQRSYDLTLARLHGGVAPRSDVRQAETILAQAQSDRAAQVTLVAQGRNALELLAGGPVADALLPVAIERVDGSLAALPAGLDSRILLRRPDVVQAEYGLRAANARIGAARAAFFPTIGLTALAGFASTALTSLFTGNAFSWSVVPTATLPIFDGGANRGNLQYARAQQQLATAQYQRAIQTAFREVADALARQGTIGDQFSAQSRLEAAAQDANTLEYARYREGIDPFLNALDTQRTLYSARRAMAQARLTRAENLVSLYQALGGDTLVGDTATPGPAA